MEADVKLDAQAHGFDGRFGQVGVCGAISAVKIQAETLALQETFGDNAGSTGLLAQALPPGGQPALEFGGGSFIFGHQGQHVVK